MPGHLDRRMLAVLAGASLLGITFIATMPPGLPYDEPSHWLNVQYYLHHWRIPVLGDPDVSYEAQMGPLAYVVMAVVAWPFSHASTEAAFYACRVVGLVELLALVFLVWRLARKALPDHPGAALIAAAALGLDPMLLAMSTSVQNDVLAILLAVAALDVATQVRDPSPSRAVVTGLLVALGLLAKITVWPTCVVLGVWLLWRRHWISALAYGLTVVAVAGWWFVRNQRLYGDLTGRRGVGAAGYDFPAAGVDPVHVVRDAVTYLWIPVEYVRNAVEAPLAVEVVVVALTLIGWAGAAIGARALAPTGHVLLVVATVAVAGWLVVVIAVQSVAFRFAYVALPAWFVLLGGLGVGRRARLLGPVVVVGLLALDVWFLVALTALDVQPLQLHAAASVSSAPRT